MLLALLFKYFDLSVGLLLIKGILYGSIIAIAFICSHYFVGQESQHPLAILVGALAILNPGYLFNAGLGMENVVFTALVTILMLTRLNPILAVRADFRSVLLSTVGLGVAAIIRPEGLVVLGLTMGVALIGIFQEKTGMTSERQRILARSLVICFGTLTIVGVAQYFYFLKTGMLLSSASAQSRIVLARAYSSIQVGPVWFDPGFTVRLLAYPPLSGIALIGAIRIIVDSNIFHHRLTPIHLLRLLHVLLVFTFWFFYSFVVGAAQVSRYTMFLLPLIGALAVYAFSDLGRPKPPISMMQGRLGTAFVIIGLLWIFSVYGIEYRIRYVQRNNQYTRHVMIEAPALRQARTDSLLRSYGESLNPQEPIRIAAREVQLRYFVDDRIYVVSVDGRTLPLGHRLPLRADGMVDEMALLYQERPAYISDWFSRRSIRASIIIPALEALQKEATAVKISDDSGDIILTRPSGKIREAVDPITRSFFDRGLRVEYIQ
jgi:hypothetical protein